MKFKVTWNGKKMLNSLQFEFPEEQEKARGQIVSLFGYGIISFRIPWLFRTSEGFGLFVRGPTNHYKENVVPLDGFVETDWAPYTFTRNWKIVKPNSPIWFKKGEAVCMIIPYPIAVIEQFKTRIAQIDDEPELLDAYCNGVISARSSMSRSPGRTNPKSFTGSTTFAEAGQTALSPRPTGQS